MISEAIVTCPHCGFKKEETMPHQYLLREYLCQKCGKTLTPKAGDCCIFCSHSNMICPPQQEKRNCCSG